ncbi:DUF6011 domain-containing protein [Tsukamurella sp. NPDC003166]|uniref:DUF6011 domain-containing protein n=1 Tax=Tsukamurella sp. NPDC003166 TaxID=3154444 RepID=UPI00339E6512
MGAARFSPVLPEAVAVLVRQRPVSSVAPERPGRRAVSGGARTARVERSDDEDLPAGQIAATDAQIFEALGHGWVLCPRCSICGAPLTARASRARGMGPACATKAQKTVMGERRPA